MRPDELSRRLKLDDIAKNHLWKVEPSCATTGEGIFEGLAWLGNNVKIPTKWSSSNPHTRLLNRYFVEGEHSHSCEWQGESFEGCYSLWRWVRWIISCRFVTRRGRISEALVASIFCEMSFFWSLCTLSQYTPFTLSFLRWRNVVKSRYGTTCFLLFFLFGPAGYFVSWVDRYRLAFRTGN